MNIYASLLVIIGLGAAGVLTSPGSAVGATTYGKGCKFSASKMEFKPDGMYFFFSGTCRYDLDTQPQESSLAVGGWWSLGTKTASEQITFSETTFGHNPGGKVWRKVECDENPWIHGGACGTPTCESMGGGVGGDSCKSLKYLLEFSAYQASPLTRGAAGLPGAFLAIKVTSPSPGQAYPPGTPIVVSIAKPALLSGEKVFISVVPPGSSTWLGSGYYTKTLGGGEYSTTIPGDNFKTTGEWQLKVTYATLSSVKPVTDVPFKITGGTAKAPGSGTQPNVQAVPGILPPKTSAVTPESGSASRADPTTPSVRKPLELRSIRQQDSDELALVLLNPAGGAETRDQVVEIRLGGRPVGQGRLGSLPGGRDQRLVVRYTLPPGTRGPVELEVWAGGQRVGKTQVTPVTRAR